MSTRISVENLDASLKLASGYSKAAHILMKNVGQTRDSDILHSMTVLRALALEIYFRCLYAIDQNKSFDGSNVRQIFDRLSDETRRNVTQYYNQRLAASDFIKRTHEKHQEIKGHTLQLDLEQVLQDWAESDDRRYLFESRHKVTFLTFQELEKALLQTIRDSVIRKTSGSLPGQRIA